MIVFGIGSGRCGSKSAALLMHSQSGCMMRHEMRHILPYQIDREMFHRKMDVLVKKDGRYLIYGDSAHYYAYYIDLIMARFPDAKIFCLKRDREQVIHSYHVKVTKRAIGKKYKCYRNFWQNTRGRDHSDWDAAYPKYDRNLTLPEAIGCYYDDYYRSVDIKMKLYPNNIRVFDTECLNTRDGVCSLLDFVGVPEDSRKYLIKLQVKNRWAEVRGVDLDKEYSSEENSGTD